MTKSGRVPKGAEGLNFLDFAEPDSEYISYSILSTKNNEHNDKNTTSFGRKTPKRTL